MFYTVRFHSEKESPETVTMLQALANNYSLATFTRLALRAFIATEEGNRAYDSLSGKPGRIRKSRRKTPDTVVVPIGVNETSVAPAVVQEKKTTIASEQPHRENIFQTNFSGGGEEELVLERVFQRKEKV